MFIIALSVIVKKVETIPIAINDYINKVWHSHTTEYYLTIKGMEN